MGARKKQKKISALEEIRVSDTPVKKNLKNSKFKKTIKNKSKIKTFSFNYFKENKQSLLTNFKYLGLGAISILIAIFISYFLFPENVGIFTIILTTLFLMPYIFKHSKYRYLLYGKKTEVEKDGAKLIQFTPTSSKFTINKVYDEHRDLINIYFLFFIGILLAILLFILVFPSNVSSNVFSTVGWNDNLIPTKQFGFEGQDKLSAFKSIATNNLSVIFVCFLFALIFPSAGILIIVWNAVFWGVVFTQYTLTYSALFSIKFPIAFLSIFWSALPHVLIEAISYFLATISGILLAFAIKNHFKNPDRLYLFIRYSLVLLAFAIIYMIAGTIFEIYLFDLLKNLFINL